jgi:hypothetical protein
MAEAQFRRIGEPLQVTPMLALSWTIRSSKISTGVLSDEVTSFKERLL